MARQKIAGIYKITNIINGKCYIGQSIDIKNRWRHHRWSNSKSTYLTRAFKKYGFESFHFEVLEEIDISNIAVILFTKSLLTEREQYWVDFYKSNQPEVGYNVRKIVNSNVGLKMPEEQRRNLIKLKTGHKVSEETKEKLRQANLGNTYKKGKKLTPEQCENISKSLIGRQPTDQARINMSIAQTGRKHTEETIQKIIQSKIGHEVTEETREKLRKQRTGMKFPSRTVKDEEWLYKVKRINASLTEEQVRYARQSKETNVAVGKMFGVSHNTISLIRLGKTYKWVIDEEINE